MSLERLDRAATETAVAWLGPEAAAAEGVQTLADLEGLAGRVPLSVLVKAHLIWRETALELAGDDAETLLAHAAEALRQAKQQGPARYELWRSGLWVVREELPR